ncbi:MAG TPA: LysE family translocator [Ktedonobacteraceae bacterium]|nr:LysE family translocator [Ktedonobacteraceae bacterium]
MPALSTIAIFLLAGLGILLIPGPAVLYVVTRSAAQGRRAGLASVMGIESAIFAHVIAASLGLSAILLTSALAFNVVKYLGAAYLIFLGLRTLFSKNKHQDMPIEPPRSLSRLYGQGFLVSLLNPKTALFFYAFLPQFVDPGRGAVVGQILLLGILFALMATCTDGLYALLGSAVGGWLNKSELVQRWQRAITGCIYILLGVTTAVTGAEKK